MVKTIVWVLLDIGTVIVGHVCAGLHELKFVQTRDGLSRGTLCSLVDCRACFFVISTILRFLVWEIRTGLFREVGKRHILFPSNVSHCGSRGAQARYVICNHTRSEELCGRSTVVSIRHVSVGKNSLRISYRISIAQRGILKDKAPNRLFM